MKKTLLLLCIAVALSLSIPVSAANIKKDSYIYDETGEIEEFYIRNINILGQQYYEETGNRVIYYVSESLSDDTDYILKNEVDGIKHDVDKPVLVVGYSPTAEQFYVAYSEDFHPQSLDEDVAKIRADHFIGYLRSGTLGNALMQVYVYFCNIVRDDCNAHTDEKVYEKYIRTMRIDSAILAIHAVAYIAVVIMMRLRVIPVGLIISMSIVFAICIAYIAIEEIILAGL